jgi:hypothetical protein
VRKLAKIVSMVAGVAALALALAVPAVADSPGNNYYNKMVATHTGMCAAVGNNSTSAGAGLIQYRCDNKGNKQFLGQGAGTNAYFLRILSTKMCVTPREHVLADHTEIVQMPCTNTDTQVWNAEFAGQDLYRLRNRASGLCLTVAWGMTNSGQPLDQTTCGTFGNAQVWRFVKV